MVTSGALQLVISLLQENLIHVTPAPVFPLLKRLHDWVLGMMKMLGRVLVFG